MPSASHDLSGPLFRETGSAPSSRSAYHSRKILTFRSARLLCIGLSLVMTLGLVLGSLVAILVIKEPAVSMAMAWQHLHAVRVPQYGRYGRRPAILQQARNRPATSVLWETIGKRFRQPPFARDPYGGDSFDDENGDFFDDEEFDDEEKTYEDFDASQSLDDPDLDDPETFAAETEANRARAAQSRSKAAETYAAEQQSRAAAAQDAAKAEEEAEAARGDLIVQLAQRMFWEETMWGGPADEEQMRTIDRVYGVLRTFLAPGDRAVDVTANMGHDTLLMAKCVGRLGRITSIDIEPLAIEATRELLEEKNATEQVTLINDNQLSALESLVAQEAEQVSAVSFCLGQIRAPGPRLRPWNDTGPALALASQLLRPGGLMLVVAYRGPVGEIPRESAVVRTFMENKRDEEDWAVRSFAFVREHLGEQWSRYGWNPVLWIGYKPGPRHPPHEIPNETEWDSIYPPYEPDFQPFSIEKLNEKIKRGEWPVRAW